MDQGSPETTESIEHLSQAVQQQYEGFPYPPVPIEQEYQGFAASASYILAQYARVRQFSSPKDKRAFVAGCGTGYEIHGVAVTNPGLAEIVGVDLSQASIVRAQARLDHHRLRHCRVQVGDLLDPTTLPEGPFDFIESYGVLHHTADPAQALRALAERLAPDGVMTLMLYNRKGRMIVYHIKEVLQKLGADQWPTERKVSFVRTLLSSFVPGSLFNSYAKQEREYYQYDENIIDNLFHAHDVPFDIAQVPDFLDQAGLEFLDIVAPTYSPTCWDPTAVVSTTNRDFYDCYTQLSTIDQLSVVELLNPLKRTENIFWCCHQGAKQATGGFDLEMFRSSSWQLNPLFVTYAEVSCLGQRQTLAQIHNSDPEAHALPSTQLTLHWQLLTNRNQTLALSQYQLRHLLLPLVTTPRSGAEILAAHPESLWEHLLNCYGRWEQYRIVLRAGAF